MATKVTKAAGRAAVKGKAPGVKPKKAAAAKTQQARSGKLASKKKPLTRGEETKLLGPKNFTITELKRFKEFLLAKRQETMEELDTLKESMMDVTTGEYVSESSNYSLHMEQGTDAMEREKTFLFASRESKFLEQLNDALGRVDEKTYGMCKVCGVLIPKERLDAVPTATTCAEYKNTNVPCERGRLALARKEPKK
jgi:RNA polymerase-binding transcription factor DksA